MYYILQTYCRDVSDRCGIPATVLIRFIRSYVDVDLLVLRLLTTDLLSLAYLAL